MKKNYSLKLKTYLSQILFVTFLMALLSFESFAQVRRDFTSRTSPFVPSSPSIYNVKGDFTMMGNTNLTLVNYGVNTHNGNTDMKYVDVDNNPNTVNSSMAELKFSTENNADPECSNIIYAGLYWTG